MFIQTEDTPNPNSIKFIPEHPVLQESSGVDSVSYAKNQEDLSTSPLAKRLLQIDGVEQVFLSTSFLSITKNESFDWYILKPSILGVIMEYFVNNLPIYVSNEANTVTEETDPLVRQIKEIINTRVRPSVAMDGGDIQFESFTDGIVYLRMYGACQGCPSSTVTLKNGIENMLKYYVPEVQEVRQYEA